MPLAKVLAPLVAPSATAGVTGLAQLTAGYPVLELTLRVTELTAGTARARVETSDDEEWWDPLELPAPLERDTPGKATVVVEGAGRFVRLRLEADGGEVKGAVQARALQVYGLTRDLYRAGINQEALEKIALSERMRALADGSDVALGYLRRASGVSLPLAGWGGDLTTAITKIAAYDLRSADGYQPSKETENALRQRYKDALAWLEQVAAGDVLLDDGDDSNGTPGPDMPEVYSDPPWGFR